MFVVVVLNWVQPTPNKLRAVIHRDGEKDRKEEEMIKPTPVQQLTSAILRLEAELKHARRLLKLALEEEQRKKGLVSK